MFSQQRFILQVTDAWQLRHKSLYPTRENNEPPKRECSYYKVDLQDILQHTHCRCCQNRYVAVSSSAASVHSNNECTGSGSARVLSLDVYVVAKADSQLLKANTEDGTVYVLCNNRAGDWMPRYLRLHVSNKTVVPLMADCYTSHSELNTQRGTL